MAKPKTTKKLKKPTPKRSHKRAAPPKVKGRRGKAARSAKSPPRDINTEALFARISLSAAAMLDALTSAHGSKRKAIEAALAKATKGQKIKAKKKPATPAPKKKAKAAKPKPKARPKAKAAKPKPKPKPKAKAQVRLRKPTEAPPQTTPATQPTVNQGEAT